MSFLRSTSRSSVNHVFIVLINNFFVSCGRKIPCSFLSAIRVFPFFEPAKGLKILRYLIIDFRITGEKNIVLPIKNHVI